MRIGLLGQGVLAQAGAAVAAMPAVEEVLPFGAAEIRPHALRRRVVGGAPRTRSKDDALALAKKLAEDAKTNFGAAVSRGDSGSDANLGRFPKGTLEANVEAVVFALPPGGISEPIDTPRGYWVAKRLE